MKRPRTNGILDGLMLAAAVLLLVPVVAIALIPVLPVLAVAWPLVVFATT